MGLKNTCQGVRCTLPRVTTGIRNIAPNQSRLIRLSEPCNKKIRAVRWKNRTALIFIGNSEEGKGKSFMSEELRMKREECVHRGAQLFTFPF